MRYLWLLRFRDVNWALRANYRQVGSIQTLGEDSPKVRVDDDPPTITTTVKEQGLIGDQWISWVTAALYDR